MVVQGGGGFPKAPGGTLGNPKQPNRNLAAFLGLLTTRLVLSQFRDSILLWMVAKSISH